MKKDQLIKTISKSTEISPDIVYRVMDAFTKTLSEAVAAGETIHLRGFGKFTRVLRKARPMHNFRTGETFIQPEHYEPKFQFSKEFLTK